MPDLNTLPGEARVGKRVLYVTSSRPRSANITRQKFSGEPILGQIIRVDDYGEPTVMIFPNKELEQTDEFKLGDQFSQVKYSGDQLMYDSGTWVELEAWVPVAAPVAHH